MFPFQNFPDLIQKLKSTSFSDLTMEIMQITSSLQQATRLDIQRLLETVNNVVDADLQVKIFSVLSAYILTNGVFHDAIVIFNPLYDRINDVLTTYSPIKTTITLNFVCSLLYITEEDQNIARKKSLVIHAKNMLRISGVLATMSNIFTSCMMYQDTWQALCRAFAECCSGSEHNQSYCSSLVGVCIQKCQEGHVEAFSVLHSLLQNHSKNIKLFFDCNGSNIFTREYLQYHTCMQVLNTIAQSTEEAVVHIFDSNVQDNLRELLSLYGPRSEVGQWATIVLYYLDIQSKKFTDVETRRTLTRRLKAFNKDSAQNVMSDLPSNNFNETATLLQNIAKEINTFKTQKSIENFQWNPKTNIPPVPKIEQSMYQKIIKSTQLLNKLDIKTTKDSSPIILKTQTQGPSLVAYEEDTNEMSFSFINNQIMDTACNYQPLTRKHSTTSVDVRYKTKESMLSFSTMKHVSISPQKNKSICLDLTISNIRNAKDFQPLFVSTPKKKIKRHRNSSKQRSLTAQINNEISDAYNRKHKYSTSSIRQNKNKTFSSRALDISNETHKTHSRKSKHSVSTMKQVKNRSMSARLIDAVNESCTSFLKSVTSIFRSKKQPEDSLRAASSPSESETLEKSCSYSFTTYMKRRDTILAHEQSKLRKESFENSKEGCKTCNDTIILKQKLNGDEYLRKTVKKLKMGINLYGCDFKKISRTMWPREQYMTPSVLYRLYRKLIMKQS